MVTNVSTLLMKDEDPEDLEGKLQPMLDALVDRDCRGILRALDSPMTAQELIEERRLSQTTAYRKLELLKEADLLEEETKIRDDGHHTTRYKRTFSGVAIGLTEEDSFKATMINSVESADERLTKFWRAISDEL